MDSSPTGPRSLTQVEYAVRRVWPSPLRWLANVAPVRILTAEPARAVRLRTVGRDRAGAVRPAVEGMFHVKRPASGGAPRSACSRCVAVATSEDGMSTGATEASHRKHPSSAALTFMHMFHVKQLRK